MEGEAIRASALTRALTALENNLITKADFDAVLAVLQISETAPGVPVAVAAGAVTAAPPPASGGRETQAVPQLAANLPTVGKGAQPGAEISASESTKGAATDSVEAGKGTAALKNGAALTRSVPAAAAGEGQQSKPEMTAVATKAKESSPAGEGLVSNQQTAVGPRPPSQVSSSTKHPLSTAQSVSAASTTRTQPVDSAHLPLDGRLVEWLLRCGYTTPPTPYDQLMRIYYDSPASTTLMIGVIEPADFFSTTATLHFALKANGHATPELNPRLANSMHTRTSRIPRAAITPSVVVMTSDSYVGRQIFRARANIVSGSGLPLTIYPLLDDSPNPQKDSRDCFPAVDIAVCNVNRLTTMWENRNMSFVELELCVWHNASAFFPPVRSVDRLAGAIFQSAMRTRARHLMLTPTMTDDLGAKMVDFTIKHSSVPAQLEVMLSSGLVADGPAALPGRILQGHMATRKRPGSFEIDSPRDKRVRVEGISGAARPAARPNTTMKCLSNAILVYAVEMDFRAKELIVHCGDPLTASLYRSHQRAKEYQPVRAAPSPPSGPSHALAGGSSRPLPPAAPAQRALPRSTQTLDTTQVKAKGSTGPSWPLTPATSHDPRFAIVGSAPAAGLPVPRSPWSVPTGLTPRLTLASTSTPAFTAGNTPRAPAVRRPGPAPRTARKRALDDYAAFQICPVQLTNTRCNPRCDRVGVCWEDRCAGDCGKIHDRPCPEFLMGACGPEDRCDLSHAHGWKIVYEDLREHKMDLMGRAGRLAGRD